MGLYSRTSLLLLSFITILFFAGCTSSTNKAKPTENKSETGSSAAATYDLNFL